MGEPDCGATKLARSRKPLVFARARAGAVALACLGLGSAACDDSRTGILLEVAAPDATLRVDELRFVIATQVEIAGRPSRFIIDTASSVTVDVRGRDLVGDPYRLLLSDGRMALEAAPILAAVMARRDGEPQPVAFAALAPKHFVAGEVVLHRLLLDPTATVSVGPAGCVSWTGGTAADRGDRDCDGASPPADCDDLEATVHPGAREICGNRRDDDCDQRIDEVEDRDHDGRDSCLDCDDQDRFVYPGAAEICDGKDNDCGGECDEGLDRDRDGVTDCGSRPGPAMSCGFPGPVDCLDDDPESGPGKPEQCDGKDNDCDGKCDEDFDADGDGWSPCGTIAGDTPPPVINGVCGAPALDLVDCRPDDPTLHPLAHELCNGIDDDCDGQSLLSVPCFGAGAAGCALGRAACDDTRPGGAAACVTAGSPVSQRLCAAGCAADPDPFRCAAAAGARWRLDCELAYRRITGDPGRPGRAELCDESSAMLPAVPEPVGCSWEIAGGMDQERLRVGLARTVGATPAATLSACRGRLVVIAPRDPRALAPDELVLLLRTTAQPSADAAHLRIVPRVVSACPAEPLGCKIVAP